MQGHRQCLVERLAHGFGYAQRLGKRAEEQRGVCQTCQLDHDNAVGNSYLYESSLNFLDKNYAFTRLELVDKDELDLDPPLDHQSFRIGAFTFGGVRDIVQNKHGLIGLGADVTFYSKPSALDPVYGNNPVSFHVFLRLRPPKMSH